MTKHFCHFKPFSLLPGFLCMLCTANHTHYSLKRYYLSLCFGTSQYHLCYQAVPVLSLLHSIIDGIHSERTYKIQLPAYDLPTCTSTLSALIFFRRSTAQDDIRVGSLASSTLSGVWHIQLHVWHFYVHVIYLSKLKCYRCRFTLWKCHLHRSTSSNAINADPLDQSAIDTNPLVLDGIN